MGEAARERDGSGDGTEDRGAGRPIQRYPRVESKALVEVRTSSWNPFATRSAILLDVSTHGFKLEFVDAFRMRPGDAATLAIPLAAFGILAPPRLKLRVVVKWFDAQSHRAGGVFHAPTPEQTHALEKLLDRLAELEKPRA